MPTQLVRTIALLYQMQPADIRQLSDQLLESRKRAWANALTDEARRHGCNRTPNPPRKADLDELKRISKADAQSIAETWNKEIERQIERIFKETPTSNRNTYFSRLEAWNKKRDSWKLAQISLNTETTTRQYARDQFYTNNNLHGGLWRLIGPIPVCKICTRLYGLGKVNQDVVYHNAMPAHLGCSHEWEKVTVDRVDCRELWLG